MTPVVMYLTIVFCSLVGALALITLFKIVSVWENGVRFIESTDWENGYLLTPPNNPSLDVPDYRKHIRRSRCNTLRKNNPPTDLPK